jgi:hypothetical protein
MHHVIMVMMPVAAASAAASVMRDSDDVNHRIRSESQAKGTRAVTLTEWIGASGPGYWKSVGHRDTGPGLGSCASDHDGLGRGLNLNSP